MAACAERACINPTCYQSVSCPSFTRKLAAEIPLHPSKQWPPQFATVHTVRQVLEAIRRSGHIELDVSWNCKHHNSTTLWSWMIKDICRKISEQVTGLCMTCVKEEILQRKCPHVNELSKWLIYDSIV